MVEQPSILSSLRTPMATATVEPALPESLGGPATSGHVSPTEERSPDAVSSASEATETGQSAHLFIETDCRSKWKWWVLFLYYVFALLPLCLSSTEPTGSLSHRELFRTSAQRLRQQQSVFFWSQRPPPLPAGSTKTRSHRQPASGHH